MFGEMLKMMGKVKIVARHPDGEVFATRDIVNLVTTSGKRLTAMMLNTVTDGGATYLALGSNATAIGADTNVIAEYTDTAGLARVEATTANVTVTTNLDTAQYTHTFTSDLDGQTVQEEAIAQGSSTTGYLVAVQTFGAVTLNSGDTIALTHKISMS